MANNKLFYQSGRWRYHTSPNVRNYNPICQRLDDDCNQCQQPSTIVHHLVAPEADMRKAHDWQNLVALCANHHAGGQPGETQNARYCATVGPHAIYMHPGGLLPSWHRDYIKPSPADTSHIGRLRGTSTSSVGEDAIDKALAGWT